MLSTLKCLKLKFYKYKIMIVEEVINVKFKNYKPDN